MEMTVKIAAAIILCFFNGIQCIPVGDFFEFGLNSPGVSSSSLTNGNQAFSAKIVPEQVPYIFYGQQIGGFRVSVDGGITLCSITDSTCNPIPFRNASLPLHSGNRGLLGVYWADTDTTGVGHGNVWYHQDIDTTADPDVLERIERIIAHAFMFDSFKVGEFIIITWDRVGYYDGKIDKTNTFQCVLATNNEVTQSYAIYLYADDMIQWTTGDNDGGVDGLGGIPAWVGINEGNGEDFTAITGSRTNGIIDVALGTNIPTGSLFNTMGVYVFRISDGMVPTTCVHEGIENGIGEEVQVNCTTRCLCTNTGDFSCITQPCSYDGSVAHATGDPHYLTFDKLRYNFHGTCQYVLTKLCNSNNYVISAENERCGRWSQQVSCTKSVTVSIPGDSIEILLERDGKDRGSVIINGVLQPDIGDGMIYQSITVDVIRTGGHPIAFLKTYGLRVYWNGRNQVYVTTAKFNMGKLCGLLGNYNNINSDDLQKPDGSMAVDVKEFGNSWLIPNSDIPECAGVESVAKRDVTDTTNDCSTDPAVVQEAETRCAAITQTPLTPCNSVVDPTQYIADCELDYRCANGSEREEFACDALDTYASMCAEAGLTISSWRMMLGCDISCPAGMIYQQCGPLCPQTCDNLDQPCEGGCAEGCFCPMGQLLINGTCMDKSLCTACSHMDVMYQQGIEIQPNCSTRCVCQNREFVCETVPCVTDGATCTVSGLSQYQTFDLRSFTFQGDCEYILTTPCDSDEFIITVQNGAHDQFVSSAAQVNISTANTEIILGRDHYVTVNGQNSTQTIDGVISATSEVEVLRVGGNTHVILLTQNIRIFWDGLYRVEVTVSTTWQNRLCGLCGNYNGDNTDDFVMPDGTLAASEDEFGISWITGDTTSCNAVMQTRFCHGQIRIDAINTCSLLMKNVFADCNGVVDPTSFLSVCIFDYCNCPTDRMECLCGLFASYASACSKSGVVLSSWRDQLCPIQCLSGSIYQQCGPLCSQSCNSSSEVCYGGCAEGCFCPRGQVMNDQQECVNVESCPSDSVMECHRSPFCNDASISIQADSATECCERGGRSFRDGSSCVTACGLIEGDPHFTVPLLSKEILCYSIQGYSGLAFNLIYNKDFIINAMFVDAKGDTSEATWIGELAVIPHNTNKSEAVVFDSANQEVLVVGEGHLKAAMIKQIIFTDSGTVKFVQRVKKQSGDPVIHVVYTKPQAKFDVTFYTNHLNVDWSLNYDEFHNCHGLMGQFMKKGVSIDTKKEMLIYSDGRDPVPVTRDSVMTGKLCWKANNYGHQGEGLIEGDVLDYVVPSILDATNNVKNFIKSSY